MNGRSGGGVLPRRGCIGAHVGNAVVQAYQRSSMLERRRPVLASWADYVMARPSTT